MALKAMLLLIIIASSMSQTLSSCHGFQQPPLLPPAQKRRHQHPLLPSSSLLLLLPQSSSSLTSPSYQTTRRLTFTRGGAFVNSDKTAHYSKSSSYHDDDTDDDDNTTDSESYDSYDDYNYDYDTVDAVDAQVITSNNDPRGTYQRAASTAKPMSDFAIDETTLAQIGKSYFMTSLLWLSVTMDIVTNSKKRRLIFPSGGFGGATSSPLLLSSGFVLSSITSYLLSAEFHRGATTTPTPNDILKKQKKENEEYVFTMNERVRKKMHLYLFLFGILNLGANLNSSKAQFLGMSGFIINVHNALIALNSWQKDALVEGQTLKKELMDMKHSFVKSLFFWKGYKGGSDTNNDDSLEKNRGNRIGNENDKVKMWLLGTKPYLSTSFSIASLIAIFRAVSIIVSSLVPYYLTGSIKTAPIEKMQLIGLHWAKLARAVLCGGLCLGLRDEVQDENNFRRWGYKNGLVASIALFVSIGLLL